MKVEEALFMVHGDGPTSYSSNSWLQRKTLLQIKPLLEEVIEKIHSSIFHENLVVADLCCSSGPNAFAAMSHIISIISKHAAGGRGMLPEIQFYLNDLPGNDFNDVFSSLDQFNKKLEEEIAVEGVCHPTYYVAGVPGSFYKRLFLGGTIHLFHSCYSLHWLSQVPPGLSLNGKNICDPVEVHKLYLEQFKRDFSNFLKLRSEEIVQGGHMILSFPGRIGLDFKSGAFELLAKTINSMVEEGLVEEDTFKDFNIPIYKASMDEVKQAIKIEGSFELIHEHILQHSLDQTDDLIDNIPKRMAVASTLRAAAEPLLAHHFGEAIMEEVFSRFEKNMARFYSMEGLKATVLVVTLKANKA